MKEHPTLSSPAGGWYLIAATTVLYVLRFIVCKKIWGMTDRSDLKKKRRGVARKSTEKKIVLSHVAECL